MKNRRIRPEIQEWIDAALAVLGLFCMGMGFGTGAAVALMLIDWIL